MSAKLPREIVDVVEPVLDLRTFVIGRVHSLKPINDYLGKTTKAVASVDPLNTQIAQHGLPIGKRRTRLKISIVTHPKLIHRVGTKHMGFPHRRGIVVCPERSKEQPFDDVGAAGTRGVSKNGLDIAVKVDIDGVLFKNLLVNPEVLDVLCRAP